MDAIRIRPERFYIWSGNYVGDELVWWRPEARGYTTALEDAGQFTREEALRHTQSRGRRDVAFPVEVVRSLARLSVVRVPDDAHGIAGRDLR